MLYLQGRCEEISQNGQESILISELRNFTQEVIKMFYIITYLTVAAVPIVLMIIEK